MLVVPKVQRLAFLDALVALTLVDDCILHLSKTDFTPDANTVIADFTEADFTGYAASSAITWGAAILNGNGEAVSVGAQKTFTCTGLTITNTIYTWFLKTAAGAYLAGGAFDPPLNFAAVGAGHVMAPELRYGGSVQGEMNVIA